MEKESFIKKYIGFREVMLISLTFIIVVVGFFITNPALEQKVNNVQTSGNVIRNTAMQSIITTDNFPEYASSQQIVKDLPKNAEISIKFYSFEGGQRQIQASYTMTKGKVEKKDASSPDIEIMIHSKYLPEINNLCATLKKAMQNGDVAYQTNLNSAALLWKYKGMMKYRDCLGI
jgi:hypothetical protein